MEYKDRRRGPRYSFIASAELIEQRADVRIASRVSELSMGGCYLDMMNPFPMGTSVLVKISAGNDFFQANESAAADEQNVAGIHRCKFLMRMLASTLWRNIGNGSFQNLQ